MADWLAYKGQYPWLCDPVVDKVEYNEGSSITKSPRVSGGSPIWKVNQSWPAITPTHIPCGYWTKGDARPIYGYRYYSFKFANNYAPFPDPYNSRMGIRRLVLSTDVPELSDEYVKATSTYTASGPTVCSPYRAMDRSTSLIGSWDWACWMQDAASAGGYVIPQRFNIDLGIVVPVTAITYSNAHYNGSNTYYGIKNFSFWGSNSITSFWTTAYENDADWEFITSGTFNRHSDNNVAELHTINIV